MYSLGSGSDTIVVSDSGMFVIYVLLTLSRIMIFGCEPETQQSAWFPGFFVAKPYFCRKLSAWFPNSLNQLFGSEQPQQIRMRTYSKLKSVWSSMKKVRKIDVKKRYIAQKVFKNVSEPLVWTCIGLLCMISSWFPA